MIDDVGIHIERWTNYSAVAEASGITQGWDDDELGLGQWRRLLKAEHSPIYVLQIAIRFVGVPYLVHTHNVRHRIGTNHYVRSQRPDSMNPVDYDRSKAPQDAPVDHLMIVNPGSLINIANDRLCFKAWHETQHLWWRVKTCLETMEDPYMAEVGRVMLPKCYYRDCCPEPKPCSMIGKKRQGWSVYEAYERIRARETEGTNE